MSGNARQRRYDRRHPRLTAQAARKELREIVASPVTNAIGTRSPGVERLYKRTTLWGRFTNWLRSLWS